MTAGGYPYPPRSPLHKAQALRKARTRFAGESRNCFPCALSWRQGMKIAVRFSIIPLRPSCAVRDGVCFTSFAYTYLSLGFRFIFAFGECPTGAPFTSALRPSGAVQDGMHRTSFVRAYPSLGFRLAASPTGRARLRPAKPLNEDWKQRVFPLCTPLVSHVSMVILSV